MIDLKILAIVLILAFASGVAFAQDLISGTQKGGPVNLSGLSPDVFDGAFFQVEGWFFDVSGSSMTPSQAAFLSGDDGKDGLPYGNRTVLRCGRGPT